MEERLSKARAGRRAGQIIKNPSGTWTVRVFLGRDASGKKRYLNRTVKTTKRDADEVLEIMLAQVAKGETVAHTSQTLEAYIREEWLPTIRRNRRPRTVEDYRTTLERYAIPHLGTVKLDKLTPADIAAWIKELLTTTELANRTIRQAHEILRNALEHARRTRRIATNPAKDDEVMVMLPPKQEAGESLKERTTVTAGQLKAFLEAADSNPMGAYWLLLLLGGLRPSEALALKWSDLTGDSVRIVRSLADAPNVPFRFEPVKTKRSRRTVVLPKVAIDALNKHKESEKEAGTWEAEGLIFHDGVGGPLRQDRTRKAFAQLLEDAGLPHMRIYDLRHSAATLLLEAGESLKVISERLGHSTVVLTGDTYSHVHEGMQRAAAQKLEALL